MYKVVSVRHWRLSDLNNMEVADLLSETCAPEDLQVFPRYIFIDIYILHCYLAHILTAESLELAPCFFFERCCECELASCAVIHRSLT